MNGDKMMQLAHKAGMVEWFNSNKVDWISYRHVFERFAVLVESHVRASDMTQGRVDETAKGEREWVGLTDEEIQAERHKLDQTAGWTYDHFARAIEAKLKEKNT